MNSPRPGDSSFPHPGELTARFDARLSALVDHEVLGVFILALANASFFPATFERFRDRLRQAFARWERRFDRAEPQAVDAAVDDVEVFLRLRALGFERLRPTSWRACGSWELQYNPLRALRPPRMSDAVVTTLSQPFDPARFNFNRPFLRDEILAEGDSDGVPVRLLYNKFPFAERHGLLVPWPEAGRAQLLDRKAHELVWRLADRWSQALPGVGFGYNAYGAYASVNHLHFQLFDRSEGRYPIESEVWRHNGGERDYPLAVRRCVDSAAAWAAIAASHRADRAYNLLYRPGVMYLVARARQGSYRHSPWTGGFAWAELAGAFTLHDEQDFADMTPQRVEEEMTRLRLDT
jgi:diadenosine tetraphosphate (Ap4A) HIT family hydrolase